ncbi:jg23923 [Pararge aegeria aegeria]|uniref:Jg23923 protein n=1 Tax=Pararge aegeria aegeria TaxID=348720 RepID=A0A8S4QEX5_9NEOP|nr:jg23923 [Pararge aegeria aegeria]
MKTSGGISWSPPIGAHHRGRLCANCESKLLMLPVDRWCKSTVPAAPQGAGAEEPRCDARWTATSPLHCSITRTTCRRAQGLHTTALCRRYKS